MSLLDWQTGKREDRDALRSFRCAHEPARHRGPAGWRSHARAPWEREAQALIRSRLKPVGGPGRTVLLGWDDAGELGAVVSYVDLTNARYVIEVIAASMRHRFCGGGVAREALGTALQYITADADDHGHASVVIGADIHRRNEPSRRLFRSEGFAQTFARDDDYETWATEVIIAGALRAE